MSGSKPDALDQLGERPIFQKISGYEFRCPPIVEAGFRTTLLRALRFFTEHLAATYLATSAGLASRRGFEPLSTRMKALCPEPLDERDKKS